MDEIDLLINRVYFITSLSGIHQESAEDLFKNYIKKYYPDNASCIYKPKSKNDLISLLKTIREEMDDEIFPLIHFETHGLDTGKGISLENNDEISWFELRDLLLEINIKCQNNLFLVLAACNSIYIVEELVYSFYDSLNSRTPFFGFVGAVKNIDLDELIISLPIFYEVLAIQGQLKKAVTEMNLLIKSKYSYYDCFSASIDCINGFSNNWIKKRGYKFTQDPVLSTQRYCQYYEYTYNKGCTKNSIMEIMLSKQFYLDFLNKRMNEFLHDQQGRFPLISDIKNFDRSTPKYKKLNDGTINFYD